MFVNYCTISSGNTCLFTYFYVSYPERFCTQFFGVHLAMPFCVATFSYLFIYVMRVVKFCVTCFLLLIPAKSLQYNAGRFLQNCHLYGDGNDP